VLGAAFGCLIVLAPMALSAHSFQAFFSLGGLVIVVGGVIAVAFMSFQAEDVHDALGAVGAMLREPHSDHDALHGDMLDIIRWARLGNTRGMRELGTSLDAEGIDDPFVKYGLNMVLSGYTQEDLRSMMETAAEAGYERESAPADVLRAMASHAPAFGMVGTLVGMVAMLGSLTDNISSIGSTLAVSFLSTLYGVVSARMIYIPAASRLQQDVDVRHFRHQMVTEGMVMLVANESPSRIQDRLNGFLRPEARDYLDVLASPSVAGARQDFTLRTDKARTAQSRHLRAVSQ
jgi:chemotaxis protein MotA